MGAHLPLGAGGVSAGSGQRVGGLHNRVRSPAGSRRGPGPFSCVFPQWQESRVTSLGGHQSHEHPTRTAPRLWAPPRGPTSDTTALGVGLAQESGGGAASTRLATARWLVQDVGQARPPAPRGPRLLPTAAELLARARPPRRPGQRPLLREGLVVCGSPPVPKGTIHGASRLRLTRRGAPWPSACGADPAGGGRAYLLPRGG